MRNLLILVVYVFIVLQSKAQKTSNSELNYGHNLQAGATANVNGINMYYEIYGQSTNPPLLLINGSGGRIYGMRYQIDFFKDRYRVIVADSRSHGQTDDGVKKLTYDLMAEDYASLCDYLKLEKVSIIGQSDGAIIALLLAMNHPVRFEKVVANSPNLRPDSTAFYSWFINLLKKDIVTMNEKISKGDNSKELLRKKMQYDLLDQYPNIDVTELANIRILVLIMTADDDMVKPEHILEIYHAIPQANLAMLPGATHFKNGNPDLFNYITNRFLINPFQRPSSRAILENIK